uniref:Secretion protein HlyD n=1 Tax=Cyanothece sp. (strain PCC 7425 / ATCC 29141) TaxID=395961 RepID=B8HM13_CYAP4
MFLWLKLPVIGDRPANMDAQTPATQLDKPMTQGAGEKIFRKEALERLSSPEQLDQLMQVVSPQAWLPLGAAGFMLAVALLWSVFGRIPITVTGQGVLIAPRGIVQAQSTGSGRILTLEIKQGDRIQVGEEVATLDQSLLRRQLEQQQANLALLEQQNRQSDRLLRDQITLERRTLERQRRDLQASLEREGITPVLRQQSEAAIVQKRRTLEQQIQQNIALMSTLKQRRDSRLSLYQQGVLSQDIYLQAEQDYLNAKNQLDAARAQLQDLQVQSTNIQRDYLQNLNRLDEIATRLRDLDSQAAKLNLNTADRLNNQTNQIQEVKRQIGQLQVQLANQGRVVSEVAGRVLEVSVVPGQVIEAGFPLATIAIDKKHGQLESLAYFSDADGKKIKPGMTVQVTPSLIKREQFGGILGSVASVSPFPVSSQQVSSTVGQPDLGQSLTSADPVRIEVIASLEINPNSPSGYQWSSSAGPDLQLSPGTTTQVRVRVGERAPISYIIPILRSMTGIY